MWKVRHEWAKIMFWHLNNHITNLQSHGKWPLIFFFSLQAIVPWEALFKNLLISLNKYEV